MSDFNKGDFTQQGVNGHVRATLRLNEKRYVELDLTTNENARGCTITGNVHDRLNNLDYPIGAAKTISSKTITENGTYNASVDDCDGYNPVTVNVPQPSGNIAITENTAEGVPLDIAQYATATVNVPSSGVDFVIPEQTVSTSADSRVEIPLTNFPEVLRDRIVLQLITTAYGQPFHELLVLDKTTSPIIFATGYTITTYGEIAGQTMKLTINIFQMADDPKWYITIFVNDTQTAFANVLMSAIGEWTTTPV